MATQIGFIPFLIIFIALIIFFGYIILIYNRITNLLQNKYPRIYKDLSEPKLLHLNPRRGFWGMYKLYLRLVFNPSYFPEEIRKIALPIRILIIISIIIAILFVIALMLLLFILQ